MSPRFILGRENVPCVAEVVNRSLKADCTDYTNFLVSLQNHGNAVGEGGGGWYKFVPGKMFLAGEISNAVRLQS